MKLIRNTTPDGTGKYALIDLRKTSDITQALARAADGFVLLPAAAVNLGTTAETAFFALKLKDQFAEPALRAYVKAVYERADALAVAAIETDRIATSNRTRHSETAPIWAAVLSLRQYAADIRSLVDDFANSDVETKIPD